MSDKRQMLPDNPTVTDLHAVIGELQDQLAMMHEECDEHEENDTRIIGELRAQADGFYDEVQRLRAENERLRALETIVREHIGHRELGYHLQEWLSRNWQG